MNLDNITTQPFILSLFKREDGVRFLLGSGAYEFKNSQLHFAANAFLNDVVEIQGNDGALLAGQVRRASVQAFDGYVGDGTTIKSKVEQYRTNFLKFFQKNHFYTVIYIFPDGTAIQRRRGYIVDAPQVKELYQQYPEYHIAFNFEDVNYYKYSEDAEGEETYSNLANILSSVSVSGGLIWTQASSGTETRTETGTNLVLTDSTDDGFDDVEMLGATSQTTYTGRNLFNAFANYKAGQSYPHNGITYTFNADGSIKVKGTASGLSYVNLWGSIVNDYTTVKLTLPSTYSVGSWTDSNIKLSCRATSGTYFDIYKGSGATTGNYGGTAVGAFYLQVPGGANVDETIYPQIVSGSTLPEFEPYVGGTTSPNPYYPQTVQTVTGEQTITISDGDSQSQEYLVSIGKNLFNESIHIGYIDTDGVEHTETTSRCVSNFVSIKPSTQYTLNAEPPAGVSKTVQCLVFYYTDSSYIGYTASWASMSFTFTTPSGATRLKVVFRYSDNTAVTPTSFTNIQIERGSTATTYEPPIELCKIGTYQDYIYKSGNDWFLRKNTWKVVYDGSENWYYNSGNKNLIYTYNGSSYFPTGTTYVNYSSGGTIACDYFEARPQGSGMQSGWSYAESPNIMICNYDGKTNFDSSANFKTWLGTHPMTVYYQLDTPYDTQITDATLIAQLEALLGADTYNGQTLVSVSGDLASPLTITYTASIISNGGIEWDNYGAVWEEGGGGGQSIITVDSITNVLPTIKITGPASNPVLTNITTGQSIRYYGYVLDSQTLVIDVNQKTAKLNGTSVIQNVDGDWLELAPGNNRMEYTVDNSDQVSAIIEWQEIVG